MHAEITHKIPNGKLVRLSLDYDTTILIHAKICGDFFIHPEETVMDMENILLALPVESEAERIQMLLDRVVNKHHAQLIGVDTKTIASLIHEAIYQ
jgi:hypothetical protein